MAVFFGRRQAAQTIRKHFSHHTMQRNLTVEPLEERWVMYNLSGYSWASPSIAASFMPDGTSMPFAYQSSLFSNLNAVAPTPDWRREFARALGTWAESANINFHFVSDDGSASGIYGLSQGDTRFGDIRLGAYPTAGLASSSFPSTNTNDSTGKGDISLNSIYTVRVGSDPDLYSVLLHESGHSLGLDHSTSGSVMYGGYSGVRTGLTADDIAGIQALYGARQADTYDTAASNDSLSSATSLAL